MCAAQKHEMERSRRSSRHRDRPPVWIAELELERASTDNPDVEGWDDLLVFATVVGGDRTEGLTHAENRFDLLSLPPTVVRENQGDDLSTRVGLLPGENQLSSAKVLFVRAE